MALGGAEVVEAKGLLVTPGGVDPHCHIEQMSGMGLMNADTFETATRSAAMGGTNQRDFLRRQARGQRLPRCGRTITRPGPRAARRWTTPFTC